MAALRVAAVRSRGSFSMSMCAQSQVQATALKALRARRLLKHMGSPVMPLPRGVLVELLEC